MARNQRPILSVVVDTYITHFIWASCSISFPLPPPDDRPSSSLGASFNAPSVAQIRHSSLEGQIRSGRPSLAALGIWAIQDALRLDIRIPLELVLLTMHGKLLVENCAYFLRSPQRPLLSQKISDLGNFRKGGIVRA